MDKYNLNNKKYFVIRLVSLTATHDVGKKRFDDKDLDIIIDKLTPHGEVVISSQDTYLKNMKNSELIFLRKIFFILLHLPIFLLVIVKLCQWKRVT